MGGGKYLGRVGRNALKRAGIVFIHLLIPALYELLTINAIHRQH